MQKMPILARRVEIVHEHAHAHAAVGGAADVIQQVLRGFVVTNDVILEIDGALGVVRERDEAIESLLARGKQPDARQGPRVAVLTLLNDLPKLGVLRRLQRLAWDFLDVLRQARAPGENREYADEPRFAH